MVPIMLLLLNNLTIFGNFISSRISKKTRHILFSVSIHKVHRCIFDQFDPTLCLNVLRTRNNRRGKYTTRGLTTLKTGTNLLLRLEQKQSARECRSEQMRPALSLTRFQCCRWKTFLLWDLSFRSWFCSYLHANDCKCADSSSTFPVCER